jgi:pimeloyl-ACP methyl ester carboxylesterase
MYLRTIELLGTSPQYFDAHAEEIEQRIASECAGKISRGAVARQLRCLGCRDVAEGQEYRITAPTLVVAGEQDMLIPACYAREMARHIPGSEFLLVRQCGHNPFTEKPEQVVPRVVDFLTRDRRQDSKKHQLVTEELV